MPSRAARLSLLVVSAALLAASGAPAGPVITVRARSRIVLDPIRRSGAGIAVRGRLLDELTAEPMGWAELEVQLDAARVTTTSDADGRFAATLPLGPAPGQPRGQPPGPPRGQHSLRVSYAGDRHRSPSEIAVAGFDPRRRPLRLGLQVEPRVGPQARGLPVVVKAASGREPAAVPVEILLVAAGDARPVRVASARTDRSGRASLLLPRDQLGPPGRKRVEVHHGGGEFDSATVTAWTVVSTATRLSLAVARTRLPFEGSLEARGRLVSGTGAAVPAARVSLTAGGRELLQAVTDAQGRFTARVPAAELGAGRLPIQAVFQPSAPEYEPSHSEPVILTVAEPQPVPLGYTLVATGATALALVLFTLVRRRPWRRWLAGRRTPAPGTDAGPAEDGGPGALQVGVSTAPKGLVSTLRRPSDQRFGGTVRDAVSHRPVPDARIELRCGERIELLATDPAGRFGAVQLGPGHWEVTVSAGGFLVERFAAQLPHRGELADVRIDLLPVRERLFLLYRGVVASLLPDAALWGVWTPRQIFEHVRDRGPLDALRALTEFIEEAYFSRRPADETLMAEAERHIEAARRELAGSR